MITIRLTEKLVKVTIIHPDNRNNHEETFLVPNEDVAWEVMSKDETEVVKFDPDLIRDTLLGSWVRIT